MLNNMSILIIVLIVRTIIFKLKYKISGFQADPSLNGLRPKIPKAQMGLARKAQSFWAYKTKPKPGNS